jgi:putative acetyltransferase
MWFSNRTEYRVRDRHYEPTERLTTLPAGDEDQANSAPNRVEQFLLRGVVNTGEQSMQIRPFTASDAETVYEVHRRAFDGRTDESRIVQRLHDADEAVVSLVAVEDDRIVGHVLCSPTSAADQGEDIELAGLAPVGVRPERQNEGVGSSLIRHGLAECRDAGVDAVVVLGDPGYYSRFGFGRASEYGLGNEYGADEGFMIKPLHEGALDSVGGVVTYRPEFRHGER